MQRRPGRPRRARSVEPGTLTSRVRRLIGLAHNGNVHEASRLTGISYPTLNDLYTGRTTNPGVATLESLRTPYGIDVSWLLSEDDPDEMPKTGRVGLLPPHPGAKVNRRALREVLIPFSAWPMYEVFTTLERELSAQEPSPDRPIVAEAKSDALVFRLTTFLFQPLLAAEKAGESDVIPIREPDSGRWDLDAHALGTWLRTLSALGEVWNLVLPQLLKGEYPPESPT